MRRKIVIAAIIILLVLAGILGLSSLFNKGFKSEPIKIGALLSLSIPSGPGVEAIAFRDGAMLAIDEVNRTGGVNGRPLELITEDAQLNSEVAKNIFSAMEISHRPMLYISTHSSVSSALGPLAEEKQVVLVSTLSLDPAITLGKEWVFRYWPTVDYQLPILLNIIDELKIDSLGVLYLNDVFGRAVFDFLRKEFEERGGLIKGESFEVAESNFKDKIDELKHTEAIFVAGFSIHLENAFKQIKDKGFGGHLFSTNAASSPYMVALPQMNGVFATAPVIYNPNFFPVKKVREEYEAKFGKEFDHFAATGYDLMTFLANLLAKREISRQNAKILLESGFIHPGIYGTIEAEPGNHDITFPLYPVQIQDGKLIYKYSY